jgi:hypothetical protein
MTAGTHIEEFRRALDAYRAASRDLERLGRRKGVTPAERREGMRRRDEAWRSLEGAFTRVLERVAGDQVGRIRFDPHTRLEGYLLSGEGPGETERAHVFLGERALHEENLPGTRGLVAYLTDLAERKKQLYRWWKAFDRRHPGRLSWREFESRYRDTVRESPARMARFLGTLEALEEEIPGLGVEAGAPGGADQVERLRDRYGFLLRDLMRDPENEEALGEIAGRVTRAFRTSRSPLLRSCLEAEMRASYARLEKTWAYRKPVAWAHARRLFESLRWPGSERPRAPKLPEPGEAFLDLRPTTLQLMLGDFLEDLLVGLPLAILRPMAPQRLDGFAHEVQRRFFVEDDEAEDGGWMTHLAFGWRDRPDLDLISLRRAFGEGSEFGLEDLQLAFPFLRGRFPSSLRGLGAISPGDAPARLRLSGVEQVRLRREMQRYLGALRARESGARPSRVPSPRPFRGRGPAAGPGPHPRTSLPALGPRRFLQSLGRLGRFDEPLGRDLSRRLERLGPRDLRFRRGRLWVRGDRLPELLLPRGAPVPPRPRRPSEWVPLPLSRARRAPVRLADLLPRIASLRGVGPVAGAALGVHLPPGLTGASRASLVRLLGSRAAAGWPGGAGGFPAGLFRGRFVDPNRLSSRGSAWYASRAPGRAAPTPPRFPSVLFRPGGGRPATLVLPLSRSGARPEADLLRGIAPPGAGAAPGGLMPARWGGARARREAAVPEAGRRRRLRPGHPGLAGPERILAGPASAARAADLAPAEATARPARRPRARISRPAAGGVRGAGPAAGTPRAAGFAGPGALRRVRPITGFPGRRGAEGAIPGTQGGAPGAVPSIHELAPGGRLRVVPALTRGDRTLWGWPALRAVLPAGAIRPETWTLRGRAVPRRPGSLPRWVAGFPARPAGGFLPAGTIGPEGRVHLPAPVLAGLLRSGGRWSPGLAVEPPGGRGAAPAAGPGVGRAVPSAGSGPDVARVVVRPGERAPTGRGEPGADRTPRDRAPGAGRWLLRVSPDVGRRVPSSKRRPSTRAGGREPHDEAASRPVQLYLAPGRDRRPPVLASREETGSAAEEEAPADEETRTMDQIDLDTLADQVYREIMREMQIEKEREGDLW